MCAAAVCCRIRRSVSRMLISRSSLSLPRSYFSSFSSSSSSSSSSSAAFSSSSPSSHALFHRRRRQQQWRVARMSVADIKAVLSRYKDGDSLEAVDFGRIAALLTRHPLVDHILAGSDIPASIRVKRHPRFNDDSNMCFAAVRSDGSECIFSYKLCLRGSSSSGLWKIFADACRNELDAAGVITEIKKVTKQFRNDNPGLQLSLQFDRVFQEFCDANQLKIDAPKQLLRIVDRDENLSWRFKSPQLIEALTDAVGTALAEGRRDFLVPEPTHDVRRSHKARLESHNSSPHEDQHHSEFMQFGTASGSF